MPEKLEEKHNEEKLMSEKERNKIIELLGNRIKKMGKDFGIEELRRIGDSLERLAVGSPRFLQINRINFVKQLEEAGFSKEQLLELGLMKK